MENSHEQTIAELRQRLRESEQREANWFAYAYRLEVAMETPPLALDVLNLSSEVVSVEHYLEVTA